MRGNPCIYLIINPELNSEINNIICESRQAKTLQERIDELMRAWDLIPKPATQFVTPTKWAMF